MTFLIIIIVLALIFDYINGFHDAANSIATIVSTKVLTPFKAVLWAALFNFVAFFIFKDHGVANTIAKTVHQEYITLTVIISGLTAAITWNLLTWWFGIPSSSSHTLIGGFAGAAIAHAGTFSSIEVNTIITIAAFIFLAPLIGMIIAFIISLWFLNSFRKGILPKIVSVLIIFLSIFFANKNLVTSDSKLSGIKKVEKSSEGKGIILKEVTNKTPAQIMGLQTGDILLKVISNDAVVDINDKTQLDKVFKLQNNNSPITFEVIRNGHEQNINATYAPRFSSHFMNVLAFGENFKWILMAVILTCMALFTLFLSRLNYAQSERWFKRMQLVSSAALSIGHGGNDAQKVMGIITAALIANGNIATFEDMPNWVPLACYTAIALGTMSGGWKIIKTMGSRITKVTPFEGVAAETAGALTLFFTEMLKIPVSTTHTITGSIIGVGATKRLSAVRWGVTINLLWAWIITIPISAIMAAIVYGILKLCGVNG